MFIFLYCFVCQY